MAIRGVILVVAVICTLKIIASPAEGRLALGDVNLNATPNIDHDIRGVRFRRGNSDADYKIEENSNDYPAETIQDLLTESPQLKIFFKRTKVPGFGNRHNSYDESDDISMCETSFMTHWPQKLTNRKGKEKFIVNQENSYQPVYVEKCKKDVTCSLKEFFPPNYTSQCKQKYSVARLVALNTPTDRNLVVDEFDVACGCVCTLKRT